MRVPKHVLLHALGADMGGAWRHLTNFLPELWRADPGRAYTVLVRRREGLPDPPQGSEYRVVPPGRVLPGLARLAFDNFTLRGLVRERACDLVVSLTNYGPVECPVPHVNFQRNSLFFCPIFMKNLGGGRRPAVRLRRRLAIETMRRADLVVTPSRAMEGMIRESVPALRSKRFKTLYHGFSSDSVSDPLNGDLLSQVERARGSKLLYPTHVAAHKGLETLFEMVARLKETRGPLTLFIPSSLDDDPANAGRYRRLLREWAVEEEVVFLGGLAQRQMGALYRSADLMVFPSLCESFGFPMLEAMACGLPIVAADTPVNRELCGSAALYFPPRDAASGAATVWDALEGERAAGLRVAASRRMEDYDWSWRRYAREFVELIEAVA